MSDPTHPSVPEPESPTQVPSAPGATPPDAASPAVDQPVSPAPHPIAPPAGMPAAPAPGVPTPTAVPGPTPQYAPPAGYAAVPPGDTRPKTLAIIALALAAVGVVLAFIPFVTWFSGLVLLAGFIVGLVALIGKKHGGKGFSIAAVIVSVVGWIVSIVMSIASFGLLGQAALEESVREDTSSSSSDTDADTEATTDDEPVADDRQDLILVESAFGRTSYDPTTWWYVVVIDNPNENYIFDLASVDVEALDAAGTILDSSSEYRTILSGRTAISGTFLSIGDGEIAELDVLGPEATEAIRSPLDETGTFTIEGLTPTTDSYSTTVRGTVTADFESEQELVEIVVIARNPAGAIIGAEWAYIDRLPPGGTVQFEAMFLDTLPADTVYEAYAGL